MGQSRLACRQKGPGGRCLCLADTAGTHAVLSAICNALTEKGSYAGNPVADILVSALCQGLSSVTSGCNWLIGTRRFPGDGVTGVVCQSGRRTTPSGRRRPRFCFLVTLRLSARPPLLSFIDYEAVGESSLVSRFFQAAVPANGPSLAVGDHSPELLPVVSSSALLLQPIRLLPGRGFCALGLHSTIRAQASFSFSAMPAHTSGYAAWPIRYGHSSVTPAWHRE